MKRPATESMSIVDAVHWLLGDPAHRAIVDAQDLVDVLREPRLKGLIILDRDDLAVLEEDRLDGKRMSLSLCTGSVLGTYVGLDVDGELMPPRDEDILRSDGDSR